VFNLLYPNNSFWALFRLLNNFHCHNILRLFRTLLPLNSLYVYVNIICLCFQQACIFYIFAHMYARISNIFSIMNLKAVDIVVVLLQMIFLSKIGKNL